MSLVTKAFGVTSPHRHSPPTSRRSTASALGVVLFVLPALLFGAVAVSVAPARAGATTPTASPRSADQKTSYWEVASDGGIFTFGTGFFGSEGGRTLNQPIVGMAPTADAGGYWEVASDGGIFTFGDAPYLGSEGARRLNKPVVGIAATPSGKGYWLVASDGGIFTFGDAPYSGSTGAIVLNRPIVGMTPTPDGRGYWLVASDGGIFTFGDAPYSGSTGAIVLNRPIVGMTPTPDGRGYWLVASDGGIFTFGDAQYSGSTGGETLAAPIVGMAANPEGGGYWLVATDGGIFTFGNAGYYGSEGGEALSRPIAGMAATTDGGGYWLVDNNGLIVAFGDAPFIGSAPQHLAKPVVAISEGLGTGEGPNDAVEPGSYGFDLSKFNSNPPTCNATLPSGHSFGVVQVDGSSGSNLNPCLAQEAAWAGAGLNLYTYLSYDTQATGPPACVNADPTINDACNGGFAAAQSAYGDATGVLGTGAEVPWWLDVENNPNFPWTDNLAANAAFIQGAITGLQAEGINSVGVYYSVENWDGIVGSYQPAVPSWVAWYTDPSINPTPKYNCTNAVSFAAANRDPTLPNGPILITQYTDDAGGFDGDYAC